MHLEGRFVFREVRSEDKVHFGLGLNGDLQEKENLFILNVEHQQMMSTFPEQRQAVWSGNRSIKKSLVKQERSHLCKRAPHRKRTKYTIMTNHRWAREGHGPALHEGAPMPSLLARLPTRPRRAEGRGRLGVESPYTARSSRHPTRWGLRRVQRCHGSADRGDRNHGGWKWAPWLPGPLSWLGRADFYIHLHTFLSVGY